MWVFRNLKRRENATDLIRLDSHSDRKISHTSDTGKYPLLCKNCDAELGDNFDIYAKNWVSNAHNSPSGIDTNSLTLARFIASVFWRSSLSQHWMYQDFLLKQTSISASLKRATYDERETFIIGSYSIERAIDPSKGFPEQSLRGFITPPYSKTLHSRNAKRPILLMRMLFEGFVWSMIIPRVSYAHKNKGNYLKPDKKKYLPTRTAFLNDPDIKNLMVDTYRKNISGRISKRLHKKQKNG